MEVDHCGLRRAEEKMADHHPAHKGAPSGAKRLAAQFRPIDRFPVTHDPTLREFMDSIVGTGGQAGRLAGAVALWEAVLSRDRLVLCAISGAPVPFGFGPAICALGENHQIDVLDITGAQLSHDLLEILGAQHYRGSTELDDRTLASQDINRFWDTLGDERDYRIPDSLMIEFVLGLPERPMTTREFLYRLGKYLLPRGQRPGILTAAAKVGLPIYCPALGDSVLGMDLGEVRVKTGKRVLLDVILDDLEMTALALLAEELGGRTSVIIFGGGAPRNHVQQTQVGSYMFQRSHLGHKEAVRFSLEPAETGGLSGSTISEGISWKKFAPDVEAVEVFLDSNIALGIVASVLNRDRANQITFEHNEDGTLTIEWKSQRLNVHHLFGLS